MVGYMIKYSLLKKTVFLLGVFALSSARGEVTLRGRVYDAETGAVLPAANIQILGKMRGTISNNEGEFQLKAELPLQLRVSYIGYLSEIISIDEPFSGEMKIFLEPTVLVLQEVVVSGENPADQIMRKVIEKKQKLYERLKTFDAKSYTRMRFENDSGIVAIMESTSDLYWHWQKGVREVIQFKESTSNLSHIPGAVGASHIPNFYDDTIEIAGARPPGPTNPKALSFYHFTLENQTLIDEKYVFEISVRPKNFLQPGFTGVLSVLDEDYVILKVDLEPNNAVWPKFFLLQSADQHFQQQFNQFGDGLWLPVDFRSSMSVKLGMTGLDFPVIRFHQLVSLDQYRINVDLPDSLYKENIPRRLDSLATRMDDRVDSLRTIPLTSREMESYIAIDSTRTFEKAFQPRGFLAPLVKFETESSNDSLNQTTQARYEFKPELRFNRVDKFHLGIEGGLNASWLTLNGSLGYKNGSKRWSKQAGMEIHAARQVEFVVNYSDDSVPILSSPVYPPLFTGLSSLVGFHDYHHYFWQRGWGFLIQTRSDEYDLGLSLGLYRQRQQSLQKVSDYALLNREISRLQNPSIEDGVSTLLNIEFTAGDRSYYFGVTGQKGFTLRLQKALNNFLGGDFGFTKLGFTLDWRLNTFLKRRFMPMTLDLKVEGGIHWGTLPIQMMSGLNGSLQTYTPFGVLRTWNNRPFYGPEYIGLFWEHDFKTVPFELLGIDWLVRRGTTIIIHAAHAKRWLNDHSEKRIRLWDAGRDDVHHEYGFSINNLLPFSRIDFAREYKSGKVYFGFSMAKFL